MKRKHLLIAVSGLGLALLLTGCGGLLSQDGGCPACGPAIPAVPGDPSARPALDPEAIGQPLVRGEHIPGEIVVGYTDEAAFAAVLSLVGGTVRDRFTMGELTAALVALPPDVSVARAMGTVLLQLRRERIPGLAFVEPNYLYELIDPAPTEQDAYLKSVEPAVYDPDADLRPYQWGLDVIGAEAAWAHATGAGIIVAVVDTGVDGTHPDLQGKVVEGYDPAADAVIPAGSDSDFDGHGTHVAGIIAANDDGKGIVGLAPDVLIMPIPIFQPGYVGAFDAAEGTIWAVDHGAQVLNHSWGGPVYSQLIKAAMDYTLANGAIPVCAAGNDGEAWIHFPSAYPGTIAVGATTPQDTVTDFSTLGGWLSVAAPGERILSCVPTWYVQDGTGDPLLYAYWGGTSMATPFVTALAAMLRELHPGATPYQIQKLIEDTATDIEGPGFDIYSGHGRIDAAAAVAAPLPADGAIAYIYTPTASSMDTRGFWLPIPYVDVVLLQGGEVRYWAQTDISGAANFGFPIGSLGAGVAAFFGIEPGTYEVLVGGDDQVMWWARTANRVTASDTLTVGAGDFVEQVIPINTELQVQIDWTGAGDVDLAIWEGYYFGAISWSTPKTGATWGTFSGDDDGADGDGSETYTLNFLHWDNDLYRIAIDATNSTVDTQVTVTIIQNGVTETYGPYLVPAGSFGDLGVQVDWWDLLGGPWVF
jgi:hypothetical protein